MKGKSNSLFHRWLIVQIGFLAFMTAVTLGIYFYSNHHIKRQLDELHLSNLKKTEAEVNAAFASVAATVDEYIITPTIRTLASIDLKSNQRDIAGLVDDIKQTNSTAKGVSEIIVYFKNDGIFVSSAGVMNKDIFSEVYSYSDEKINEHITNIVDDKDAIGKTKPVYNGRNNINTAIYINKTVNDIFVCAVIDRIQIEEILKANLQSKKNSFAVFSKENELLFWSKDDYEITWNSLDFKESNPWNINLDNKQYVCFISAENDMMYVSLVNEANYLARQLSIQRTAIIILAISVVLGGGFSYYITRYKYKPVEKVIKVSRAVTPAHVFASDDNELEQIKSAIEFINNQKEQAQNVLNKHTMHIKNNAIKMLLDGDLQYQEMTNHLKLLVDIAPDTSVSVAVMDIESRLKISNVTEYLRELIPNIKHIVLKGGRIILVFVARAKDVTAQLTRHNFLNDLKCTVAIGSDGVGPNGIKTSFENALLGLSRKILPGTPKVIPPMKKREAGAIIISTENEIRLGGYIQSGNAQDALLMLDELINRHGINDLNYFSFKSYLFNIANVIIRSAESVLSEEELSKLLNNFGVSFSQEDYQSISKTLNDAINYITGKYKEKMNSANKRLNASIIQYIDNKISDSQLSSEMIAETMKLNSVYLRRFFKEQNGIKLWDFINMKRIEMARNFLVTSSVSINKISLKCGYISISTFVRTFKKFSGMTPGHYRNLYR